MLQIFPLNRWGFLGLCFICLLAMFVRIGDGVSTAHFRYDQARLSQMALEIAHGDEFYWTGPDNSAGIPSSPIVVWFYACLFYLSDSPLFVSFMVASINILGVMAYSWIGYRYFGALVGFFVGLTLAANPWQIAYSRYIWEPNVLIPFLGFAILAGFYGYFEKKFWAQVCFLPLLLFSLQFHYAAFFLAPIYLFVVWLGRKNILWLATLISWFLGLLVVLPFAYGLSQNFGNGSSSLETVLAVVGNGISLRSDPIEQIAKLITGLGAEGIVRNQANNFHNLVPRSELLWQAQLGLVLTSFVFIWRKQWRKYALLLLFWAFFIPLVQIPAWTGRGVFQHYHLAAMPAFAFLIAISLASIIESFKRLPYPRVFQTIIGFGFIAFFISQAVWTWQLYQYADEVFSFTNANNQTSTPLHYLMDVESALEGYDDVIILGANPHESNYYIWQALLYDSASCVRDLLINDGIVDIMPMGSYAVLVAPLNPMNPNYQVPARYQTETPIVISLREGEDPYIIYAFEAAPQWTETEIIPIELSSFANGLRLNGYYLTDEWLQLRWEIPSNGGESYQFFAHFLDEEGERIGQRDAPFYVGQHWCKGDTIITTTAINLPPETKTLRVGLYQFRETGGTESLSIVNDSGNVIGTWLDIILN